jgi:hypothetical protein
MDCEDDVSGLGVPLDVVELLAGCVARDVGVGVGVGGGVGVGDGVGGKDVLVTVRTVGCPVGVPVRSAAGPDEAAGVHPAHTIGVSAGDWAGCGVAVAAAMGCAPVRTASITSTAPTASDAAPHRRRVMRPRAPGRRWAALSPAAVGAA